MDLTIKIDSAGLINRLHAVERQVPFALALGTNRTIEEVQAAIQKHEYETYTIRRPWVVQGIKIDNSDRATKDNPRAIVHLDPERAFMSKFQEGTIKLPMGKSIAIPIAAKRSKSDLIQKGQRPRAFGFTKGYSSIRTRATIWRGEKGAWMIQRPDGSGTIFQRVGKAERNRRRKANAERAANGLDALYRDPSLKVLYVLRPKAQTPRNLEFYEIGERVVRERYVLNVLGMLDHAIKTAR